MSDTSQKREDSAGSEVPSEAEPILNLRGERVALGPLRRDYIPLYVRWLNDLQTHQNLGGFVPQTVEHQERWYERQVKSESSLHFTIYDAQDLAPIGISGLEDIDYRNRTAEFLLMVGEERYRGGGRGTETTRLLLDYAFNAVGLHNVQLRVYEFNAPAMRAYEKVGFREYGRRRQSYFMGGRSWDEVFMDALATEFDSHLPGRDATSIIPPRQPPQT